MSRNRYRWLAATVTALAACAAVSLPAANAGPSNGQSAPQAQGGQSVESGALQEVWRSDFDGPSGAPPSADDWIIDTGTGYEGGPPNWGTGETQTYTDDSANLSLDGDGKLKITALKDGDTWTSGRIESKRTDFAAPEGGTMRIEASIKLPDVSGDEALGYWPAFWTLGDEYRGNYWNWPGVGEFDIMENVNGLDRVWGVLHCGVDPGGPCNETEGLGAPVECEDCSADFREFALELDRSGEVEELRWYLDGVEYHSVSSADMDAQTWADATHHGHFVLLNLAIGGAFPDGVAGHPTPTEATEPGGFMLVDYVAVSQTQEGR